MVLQKLGIEHKHIPATFAATIHLNLRARAELPDVLREVAEQIPPEYVAGPAFALFQFISSFPEGYEVEVGFPVSRAVEGGRVTTRQLPALEVLALVHRGPIVGLGESVRRLYGYMREHGLISDEFRREVYLDWQRPGQEIELQAVLHDWTGLLERNVENVLGAQARQTVMRGCAALTIASTLEERFLWIKGAMERLESLADDDQRHDVVSGCAHVFPRGQLEELRAAYQEARASTGDGLAAVDAVIAHIARRGWGDAAIRREGHTVYATKPPADPEGYEQAQTAAERRAAYCFCPIMRTHLDAGMPDTYCYCGAGWCRQQWEYTTGRPVRVERVRLVHRGDDCCEFAIHLPADL